MRVFSSQNSVGPNSVRVLSSWDSAGSHASAGIFIPEKCGVPLTCVYCHTGIVRGPN